MWIKQQSPIEGCHHEIEQVVQSVSIYGKGRCPKTLGILSDASLTDILRPVILGRDAPRFREGEGRGDLAFDQYTCTNVLYVF